MSYQHRPIYPLLLGVGILVCSIVSCIDVIQLDAEDNSGELLIVEAELTLNSRSAKVQIRRAASFAAGPDGVETPVSGGTVSIQEVDGPLFELEEEGVGTYRSVDPIGEPGKSYILQINVAGNSYTSAPETMPARVPIDSISYRKGVESFTNSQGNIENREVLTLLSSTTLPQNGVGSYLRYRVTGNYEFQERITQSNMDAKICYVFEQIDFNQLSIIDGSTFNGGKVNQEPFLTKIVDSRLAYDYCFTIVQISITESEYEFWEAINDEFERTGDIFETPPAKINGNVFNTIGSRNDVIGIFSVNARDSVKFLTQGNLLGIPPGPCLGFPPPVADSPCYECLKITNSSTTKPECF